MNQNPTSCHVCGGGQLALGYQCSGCTRVGLAPNDRLDALATYLFTEADYSRSWTDGRRGADQPKSEAYNARRVEIAEEREAWAAEIAALRAENALLHASMQSKQTDSADRWTLDEALALCREIENYAPDFGCHVALTGGVLYKDGPRKDLDLVFYRIRDKDLDVEGLFASLFWFLGIRRKTPDDVWCVKAEIKGKAIDCFLPEAEEGEYPEQETAADVLEDEARAHALEGTGDVEF